MELFSVFSFHGFHTLLDPFDLILSVLSEARGILSHPPLRDVASALPRSHLSPGDLLTKPSSPRFSASLARGCFLSCIVPSLLAMLLYERKFLGI